MNYTSICSDRKEFQGWVCACELIFLEIIILATSNVFQMKEHVKKHIIDFFLLNISYREPKFINRGEIITKFNSLLFAAASVFSDASLSL